MWPSAEAVRGWRRPNRPTVWTGFGTVRCWVYMRVWSVFQVHVQIVEPETAKKEGDFKGGYLLHFSTVSGAVRA